ncbi:Cytochrome P450 4V2 [Desmophyllum pertusum]|uniref:Cytochrome P450 4V2 n=1 Tax=Desmophyllum pertusum TaxID=174260 RepID=A0A9X0D244_9CNID|nr:Cytochrome P450 4V2 [Desmophyllum pertusum]
MAFFIVVALAILLLMFLLAIATLVIISKRGDVVLLKKLPGYKPHLLYGNALEMAREPDKLVEQLTEWINENTADGLMCIWLGPLYPFVLVYKPELIEVILNSSRHITKSLDYQFLHPWLGTVN